MGLAVLLIRYFGHNDVKLTKTQGNGIEKCPSPRRPLITICHKREMGKDKKSDGRLQRTPLLLLLIMMMMIRKIYRVDKTIYAAPGWDAWNHEPCLENKSH